MTICGTKWCAEREREHQARIAQFEAALRAVEFSVGRYSNRCVICTYERIDGHAPDCIVGKALKP